MKRRKRQEAPEGGWNVRQNVANILLNSLEILFSKDIEIFYHHYGNFY
jgi:hypothetical protein